MRKDGWIYAACEVGTQLVKIGYTQNQVDVRVRDLCRTAQAPLSLVGAVQVTGTNVVTLERFLHKALAAQRIQKEWFYFYCNQDTLEALVQRVMPDVLAYEQAREEARYRHMAQWESEQRLQHGDLSAKDVMRIRRVLNDLSQRYNISIRDLCRLAATAA